ncbi:hypothetical protein K438DRAFT_1972658 [Mycena galopus ATCC 62051]|nr:hypothetical protein K438DRAFT_1972658 [Mycena galopus ATCC 62051]
MPCAVPANTLITIINTILKAALVSLEQATPAVLNSLRGLATQSVSAYSIDGYFAPADDLEDCLDEDLGQETIRKLHDPSHQVPSLWATRHARRFKYLPRRTQFFHLPLENKKIKTSTRFKRSVLYLPRSLSGRENSFNSCGAPWFAPVMMAPSIHLQHSIKSEPPTRRHTSRISSTQRLVTMPLPPARVFYQNTSKAFQKGALSLSPLH